METHNPKKSKALLITFIAVLILLIIGYYLFYNRKEVFNSGGGTTVSKVFGPLLGTSKTPDTTTSGTTNPAGTTNPDGTTPGTTTTPTTNPTNVGVKNPDGTFTNNSIKVDRGVGGTQGPGNAGNFGTASNFGVNTGSGNPNTIAPGYNPIPTPGFDSTQPDIPVYTDPIAQNPVTTTPIAPTNICPADDPLVFTSVENAELATLLEQYYAIAPGLKGEDDLSLATSNNKQNEVLLNKVIDLTNQCESEKNSMAYNGPAEIKSNPYYNSTLRNDSYLPEFSKLEEIFNIW